MPILSAYILGAYVLAVLIASLAVLAVAAAGCDEAARAAHDPALAIWEERQARRILRARYARGEVSAEEYRRLCYELETGREADAISNKARPPRGTGEASGR